MMLEKFQEGRENCCRAMLVLEAAEKAIMREYEKWEKKVHETYLAEKALEEAILVRDEAKKFHEELRKETYTEGAMEEYQKALRQADQDILRSALAHVPLSRKI